MGERLRARDLAFLTAETPTAPCTTRRSRSSTRVRSGFDHDTLVQPDRRPDRVRAALPPARAPRCPATSRTRSGSTTRTSTSPTTYAARPCRVRGPWSSCASWSRGSCPGRSTGSRPLWEVYFVEGLEGGRVAVLTKAHQALVDGAQVVDLAQVLLDRTPGPARARRRRVAARARGLLDRAAPRGGPRHAGVAVHRRSTRCAASPTRGGGAPTRRPGASCTVVNALTGRRTEQDTPIGGTLSQQRRFVTVRRSLAEHRAVRDAHGGTVNDVVLATVTGGLRSWLMTRAESLGGLRQVRAVVPVSVHDHELEATSRRLADRPALRRPPGGRAEPGRPAAPGLLLVQGAQARPGARSRPTGSPASPASRRRPSTRSGRGCAAEQCAAASSSR